LRAKVLKLDKKLFDGKITKVVLPAVNGEMCILRNHMSIVTTLRKGDIKIFKPDGERPTIIEVDSGFCSFSDNNAVFILSN
jgi:F-type H+-transporting ATPase subunit epsilon